MAVAVPSREERAVVPSLVTAAEGTALGADDVLARLGSGSEACRRVKRRDNCGWKRNSAAARLSTRRHHRQEHRQKRGAQRYGAELPQSRQAASQHGAAPG